MTRTARLIAGIRDAFAGPAARTTIVLGLLAATIAMVAPTVTTPQPPVTVRLSADR